MMIRESKTVISPERSRFVGHELVNIKNDIFEQLNIQKETLNFANCFDFIFFHARVQSVWGIMFSVCVCSRKGRQSGTSVGFTPGKWAYISHRAYARLFKVAKTMQNELSIDPRGTLVVYMYNAHARFTY